ncbi:pif1 [Symbiodinium sp. CCMP2592]|nr:pif1 [Symbiodinium sp. CCMP2592]
MGVTHSMEEQQVKRISKALNASATAIQGINKKFEDIDVHVQRMLEFNNTTNQKMDAAFRSFERLDDTFNDRAEMFLEALVGATNSATDCLEAAVLALQKVNIRQEIDNIPKALIPLAIPFIILLIELAVSNASCRHCGCRAYEVCGVGSHD